MISVIFQMTPSSVCFIKIDSSTTNKFSAFLKLDFATNSFTCPETKGIRKSDSKTNPITFAISCIWTKLEPMIE